MLEKSFASGVILALTCFLAACAPADDDPILSPAGVAPGASASGDVAGAIEAGPTPAPEAPATPAPFTVVPAAYTLAVPPSGGESPLFETAKTFAVDPADAAAAVQWRSSDTQVAHVDAQGRVTALRAGTAILTASRGGREATASVTIETKGRLVLVPGGLPARATILARLFDAGGATLASSTTGQFDRASRGNLTAELEASVAGSLVAAGRAEGLTLHANQVSTHEVPLNVPSLATTEVSGGPGARVTLKGAKLGGWVKRSYGTLVPWAPGLTATVDGKPAGVALVGDGVSVRLVAPETFDGMSARRPLRLTIGGVPLDATYRLLDTIRITTPAHTVPVMGRAVFLASATDTAGQAVTAPALTWEVQAEPGSPGLGGDAIGGIDDSGEFTAWRPGTGVIVARSGTLEATASVTVTAP